MSNEEFLAFQPDDTSSGGEIRQKRRKKHQSGTGMPATKPTLTTS